jgi:NAD(P)-dependent dehydrogenase (short-subunit alcohol dehydrogenase family)
VFPPPATMTDRVRGRFEAGNPRVTKIVAGHLLGLIEPEDIANMAVFLASDESRMVTGHGPQSKSRIRSSPTLGNRSSTVKVARICV